MTIYSNNAAGVIAADIGPTDTIIVLSAGQGARFPAVPNGNYFYATLIHPITFAVEIVKCTGRAGDSLTVQRGRDGTTAIPFPISAIMEMRLVAEMMREFDWRGVGNLAGGVPILGIDGKVAAGQLPSTIPYTVSGLIPIGLLPGELLTETEGDARYGRLDQAETWAENQTFSKAVAVLGRLSIAAAPGTSTAVIDVGDDAQLRDVSRVNTLAIVGTQDNTQAALQFGVTGPSTGGIFTYNTATGNFQILPASGGAFGVYHEGNFNPNVKLNVQSGVAVDLRCARGGFPDTHGICYYSTSAYILFDGANFTCSNNFYAPNIIGTSDERLKKSIRRHKTPTRIGDSVELVSWEWRKQLMANAPAGRWTGPLAQAVQKFAPWHVHEGPDGWLGLDKAGLALEVAVDDAARIRKLEAQVEELQKSLQLLTKKIR